MPTARDGVVCGVVRNPQTGGEEVVVAGGWPGGADYTDVVEIYSVDDGTWRAGKRIQFTFLYMFVPMSFCRQ